MIEHTHVVLDAYNLAYRYWWPVRESTTSTGQDNSLEEGFCSGLLTLWQRFPHAQFLLAWDGEPVQQVAENPTYKAQRRAKTADRPADWHQRCDRLREALRGLFPTLYDPQNEADVEIARYLHQNGNHRSLIISTDRDLFMLLSDRVDVLRPGATSERYQLGSFVEDFGFSPARYPLYKALVGDKSDNLPGVGHFPSRVAKTLAAQFSDVDALYYALQHEPGMPVITQLTAGQVEKLRAKEGQVRSNARIVNLLDDRSPPHLSDPTDDLAPLRRLGAELELTMLVSAFEGSLTMAGSNHENTMGSLKSLDGVGIENLAPLDAPIAKLQSAQDGGTEQPTTLVGENAVLHVSGPNGSTFPEQQNGSPESERVGKPSGLVLAPAWVNRLAERRVKKAHQPKTTPVLPLAPAYYANKLTFVEDVQGAQALLDFARQRPIAVIGIDFEFSYSRPGVLVKKNHTWYDPRSIAPMLMSLVLVEPGADNRKTVYRFVVDVRRHEVLLPLAQLLRLPVKFTAHFGQVELFCLWQLGLPTPDLFWDTWTAERAFLLGIHHGRYQKEKPADELEEARAKEEAGDQVEFNCKLVTTCLRRGVTYSFAGEKERLQQSFLTHPVHKAFSDEQLSYAAADAQAAAELYSNQVQVAINKGCLDHLVNVEMPWAVTNAGMIWNGVHVDPVLCQEVQEACQSNIVRLSDNLGGMGVGNVKSHVQMENFFRSVGLLDAFRVGDKYSFDDDHLEIIEDHHPAIPLIRHLRKMQRLVNDKLFTGELVGVDGRLHPEHRQLGAESGRNTMSCPNIGGIGRALRPLVVPEEDHLIGECDLSQIEVGIAAAVYGDPDLIRMFNGRDVYTAMAKRYYAAELPTDAQELPDKVFKKKHGSLRGRMKVFTLATIYNITPIGLSRQLNISEVRAAEERTKFMAMFPSLATALRETSEFGAIRGYAYLCSGLRRWRARNGAASSWETNWMRNTPVQGSAGVVFKAAGNRLHRRYQHYSAKLILPMHDAFVFEVPRQHLQAVAKITAEVMRSTVQEYFPQLDPQVDINIDQPHCWNKDGKHRSLKLWMANPELARKYM